MDRTLFLLLAALLALVSAGAACASETPLIDGVQQLVREQVRTSSRAGDAADPALRVEVLVGKLDERLRLAPCEQIEPYIPKNSRLLGKTRVGLKCMKGVTRWNVYLPVTVNVWGQALVATNVFPAGHVLASGDMKMAEMNLAEDLHNPLLIDAAALIGRTLAKAVEPGQGLRQASIKSRQWFAAGERVVLRVAGQGFNVAGEGEAITAGMEGQPARVRTESGRIVLGQPVAERQMEISL